MAILSSREGKFYDIPDADLKKHEVPAGKVKEILAELDDGPGGDGVEPYSYAGPAQVVIHCSGAFVEPSDDYEGDVEPYGYGGHGHWGHGHGHRYGWGHRRWYWKRRRRWYY